NGRYVAATSNGTLTIWDAVKEQTLLHRNDVAGPVSFRPDGKRLACVDRDGTMAIWDAASGKVELAPGRYANPQLGGSLIFSPDGEWLAKASEDRTIKALSIATLTAAFTFRRSGGADNLTFSPDGTHLAATCAEHAVELWNLTGSEDTRILKGHSHEVAGVAF